MPVYYKNTKKYKSVRQTYNGYSYMSKKEANYAFELDMRIKLGEIKEYKRQYRLSLDVEGEHIADYYVDFAVEMADGSIEYHEVKGFEVQPWPIKWKLAKVLYPNNKFVLIK